jgi:glutamyl-tRNA reductase
MMAGTMSSTIVAGALFSAVASSKPRGSASCPRVAAGRRRGSCVVRCDAGEVVQAQAASMAASIAALEQLKISGDREFSPVLLVVI